MLGSDNARLRRIVTLALPIVGGMLSQNILNVADVLMVSRLGPNAVAAVGIGSTANFMATAFITGMSAGVQAMSARRMGEGRFDETAVPLNGGLLAVVGIALPLSVVLILCAPLIFPLLSTDPAVIAIGVPYLQVRLIAVAALGCNFAFRGYWNGVNRSGFYLRTLIVMHVADLVLSYLLIFGKLGLPELGATGAGLGTTAGTVIGTVYYFMLGTRHARPAGFLRGLPPLSLVGSMLRLSIPSGLQSLFFAAGMTGLFAILSRVGTAEAAAANVLLNIALIAYLPALGLGLASASLVGQALGRGDVDDAARWGWDVVKVGAVVLGLLGLPMAVAPEAILGAFFSSSPDVLALAVTPLRLVGLTIAVEAVGMILLNSVMGAGATTVAMVLSVGAQWGLFLPAAYVIGMVLGGGLLGIWIANISYRMVLAMVFAVLWRTRRWASAKV